MDDMGDDYGAEEDQYDPDEMIGCAACCPTTLGGH